MSTVIQSKLINWKVQDNIFSSGDSTCGQRALYQMGLTGIPIFNVNNNCATGSSALYMGNQLIAGGIADCVLALGFEKMQRGSLSSQVKTANTYSKISLHINFLTLVGWSHKSVGQTCGSDDELGIWDWSFPVRRSNVWQCCERAYAKIWNDQRASSKDCLQKPQAFRKKSVSAIGKDSSQTLKIGWNLTANPNSKTSIL